VFTVEVKFDNVAGSLALMGVSAGGVSDLAFFLGAEGSGLDRFFGDDARAGAGVGATVAAAEATAVDFEESRRMATRSEQWWRMGAICLKLLAHK
jgi:hypothetical protein